MVAEIRRLRSFHRVSASLPLLWLGPGISARLPIAGGFGNSNNFTDKFRYYLAFRL